MELFLSLRYRTCCLLLVNVHIPGSRLVFLNAKRRFCYIVTVNQTHSRVFVESLPSTMRKVPAQIINRDSYSFEPKRVGRGGRGRN